jgi:hypothetical protein
LASRIDSPFFGSLKVLKYPLWRRITSNKVVVLACQVGNQFLGSFKGLQIGALIGKSLVWICGSGFIKKCHGSKTKRCSALEFGFNKKQGIFLKY